MWVTVVGGAEPEGGLGLCRAVPGGDLLLDEQSGASWYAAFEGSLSRDVDCLLNAGIDELLLSCLPRGTERLPLVF